MAAEGPETTSTITFLTRKTCQTLVEVRRTELQLRQEDLRPVEKHGEGQEE